MTVGHNSRIFIRNSFLGLAAITVLTVAGCNSDNNSEAYTKNQKNTSLYDPMRDAAPGDDVPSAPSISSVTPDQVMGGGSAGILVPGDGPAATSLGALNGGRR